MVDAERLSAGAAVWRLYRKRGACAGLAEGDVLLALDGAPTPNVDALHKLLTGDRVGERAIVAFLRGVEMRRHAIIPLEIPGRD